MIDRQGLSGVAGRASRVTPRDVLAAIFLIPFAFACAVIADRAQIGVSTGGRGSLPVMAALAPVIALAAVAMVGQRRALGFLTHPVFLIAVAPYLALTTVLPVLGILLNGYPERTLLSATDGTTAIAFMIIGAAIATRLFIAVRPWLFAAIAVQLLYALGQAVYLAKGPGWQLFQPFHQWDVAGQDLTILVQARSTGLYVNPNELGFWAAAAVVLSWTLLTGRLRVAGVALSLLTLLLSQSRGATVALLVVVIAASLDAVRTSAVSRTSVRSILRIAVAGGVAIVAALALAPSGSLVARFQSLINVGTEGATADPNLAGRLDYWAQVTILNGRFPWGTFGSPELLLGTAIDSSWFRSFAQGSILYAATLALLLFAAVALSTSPYRRPLRLIALLTAVAGITQTPLSYPAVVLFWMLFGAELQASNIETTRVPRNRTSTLARVAGSVSDGPVHPIPDRPSAAVGRASALRQRTAGVRRGAPTTPDTDGPGSDRADAVSFREHREVERLVLPDQLP